MDYKEPNKDNKYTWETGASAMRQFHTNHALLLTTVLMMFHQPNYRLLRQYSARTQQITHAGGDAKRLQWGAVEVPLQSERGLGPTIDSEICVLQQHSLSLLCSNVLQNTKFNLAPRGYGRTSFRLAEIVQSGRVPVYMYDDAKW